MKRDQQGMCRFIPHGRQLTELVPGMISLTRMLIGGHQPYNTPQAFCFSAILNEAVFSFQQVGDRPFVFMFEEMSSPLEQ